MEEKQPLKASELIKQLEELIEKYGDFRVGLIVRHFIAYQGSYHYQPAHYIEVDRENKEFLINGEEYGGT